MNTRRAARGERARQANQDRIADYDAWAGAGANWLTANV